VNVSENLDRQAIVDQEHVRILSIAYLVSAVMNALFSLFGLLYVFVGLFMTALMTRMPTSPAQPAGQEAMLWLFVVFGLSMFAIMMTFGVLKYVAYRRLRERRSRTFCIVVAGISCLGIPYGTLLGIFTLAVLTRPSVVKLFAVTPPPISTSSVVAGDG
jgi:membrane-associated HD superfamily phosphohydrolase